MKEIVTVNNIQHKVDQVQRAYAQQYEYPESDFEQEHIDNIEQADSAYEASESGSE